jgi:glycosyltransferase involved in cell wall biosynthesis
LKKLFYLVPDINHSGGVNRVLSTRLNFLVNKYAYTVLILSFKSTSIQPVFYDFDTKIKITYLEEAHHELKKQSKFGLCLKIVRDFNPNSVTICYNSLNGTILAILLSGKYKVLYERHNSRTIREKTLFKNIKLKISILLLDVFVKRIHAFVVLNEEEAKSWRYKNTIIRPNPFWNDLPLNAKVEKPKVVLAVGRQAIEKGYDSLLLIWKDVVKDYPDWQLHIYGAKDSALGLPNMAKDFGITNSVKFFNPIKDIEAIYASGKILLNTSVTEAFGLTIIEAMSYGLPVVAFNNNGAKSLIKHNYNGFLVDFKKIDKFARQLKSLIANEKEFERLSVNAIKSTDRFNLYAIMEDWHKLYKSL